MSGKLKEVRTRIGSVTSTQQITKAMKMVSAAKLRRAQDAILQMRPYSLKMGSMLENIAAATQGDVQIDLADQREVKHVLIVVVTSDKGLCGAFNTNVTKAAKRLIEERYAHLDASHIHLMLIGKKGYDAFKRSSYRLLTDYQGLFHHMSYQKVVDAANFVKQGFLNKEYDEVMVIFNKFKNAATQILETEQFLPIRKVETKGGAAKTDFIFDPDKTLLIEELVPRILNTSFYRYLLDSVASEHGARMTAMDKASDNANELLKELKIAYNRARQAAITTELTEIVSGAAALQGN
jgi:F-type H+-transporting ATPase subunit gamma